MEWTIFWSRLSLVMAILLRSRGRRSIIISTLNLLAMATQLQLVHQSHRPQTPGKESTQPRQTQIPPNPTPSQQQNTPAKPHPHTSRHLPPPPYPSTHHAIPETP